MLSASLVIRPGVTPPVFFNHVGEAILIFDTETSLANTNELDPLITMAILTRRLSRGSSVEVKNTLSDAWVDH